MLKLGSFDLISYEMSDSTTILFHLSNVSLDDALELRGKEIKLTDPSLDDAVVATFPGYVITGVYADPKTRTNMVVVANQNLSDGTAEAIVQLQNDMTNVLASNNTLMTAVPSILMNANLPDDSAYSLKNLYPKWAVGQNYKKDQMIQYDGELYKIAQDHTSQDQYRPGTGTESLYVKVVMTDSGYPLWTMPTGAHDAYNNGDIVYHNNKLWQSKVDGNVWEPGTDTRLWFEYSE